MSLIDDALKRAADEAARRELEGSRDPLPHRQGGRPPSAGGGRALAIGLAAGVFVSLLAFTAYRLTARKESARPLPPAPAAASLRAPLPEVVVPPPVSSPADGARPLAGSAGRNPPRTAPRSDSASAPTPVTPGASSAGDARGQRLRNGDSFSGEVTLPGGARIALEGIVYSDSRPVALINGKVLAPGDTVEGFRLVKISPDRIELQNGETTISILAK